MPLVNVETKEDMTRGHASKRIKDGSLARILLDPNWMLAFQVEKYACSLPIGSFSRYLSLPHNFSATRALVDLRMARA